jgi:large subunit ribosomal protein L13
MENTVTIDATNKKIGRIASEAAFALMGKDRTDYAPNAFPTVAVTITGANALDISDKKAATKIYRNYSGYPSGLRDRTLAKVVADQGNAETLRIAIRGMLPPNKLRSRRLKLLTILG